MKTDMLCVVQSKVQPQLGLEVVTCVDQEVWTKNFKPSLTEEDDVEMTGDREDSGESSRDEDEPIPYISNDNFSQEVIFDYWNDKLSGNVHVKRTYPDVVVALDLVAG